MNTVRISGIVFFLVAMSATTVAASNENHDAFARRQMQLATSFDGSSDPRNVPVWETISFVLNHFDSFETELEGTLSDDALFVLRAAATAETAEVIEDIKTYDDAMHRLCMQIDRIDALTAAGLLQDAVDAYHDRRNERYSGQILGRLGGGDKVMFETYLRDRIAKGTRGYNPGTRESTTQLAFEFPNEYLNAVRRSCDSHLANRGREIIKREESDPANGVDYGGYVRTDNK